MIRLIVRSIISIIMLGIFSTCASPSKVIVGKWEGKGEISISRGKKMEESNFIVYFYKDGEFILTPAENEKGEISPAGLVFTQLGTYEITKKGEITGEAPGEKYITEIVGTLNMKKKEIELKATSNITEKGYREAKANFEGMRFLVETQGYNETTKALAEFYNYDFSKEFPKKEDFTFSGCLNLKKAVESEEKTKE